jgi:hypothetical protein
MNDLPGSFNTVHSRHFQVHEHQIRLFPGCQFHRLPAVLSLPYNLDVFLQSQQQLKAVTHGSLVIADNYLHPHDPQIFSVIVAPCPGRQFDRLAEREALARCRY